MNVLRLLTRPNAGGPTRQAIALWHAHRALGVRTLLVVGTCAGEPELAPALCGVPSLAFGEALRAGPRAEGVVVLPGLRRGASPLGLWRASAALRALVRAVRPQVVHTHLAEAGWLGRSCALRERVPVVAHTFHGHVLRDYFRAPREALLRVLERRLAARSDLIFAVSESCRRELLELGIGDPKKVRTIRPAVELDAAREAGRAHRATSPAPRSGVPRLAWCGRLVPIKRFAHFVAVLDALPHARALVVGDGPERALVERLGDRVEWKPFLARPWDFLAAADLLVLPSLREGLPLAALEAFAAGVAVAGHAVPGVADLLTVALPERTLPAADDAAGLTTLVRDLLAAPAERDAACARMAGWLLGCEPTRVARTLLEAYEGALRTKHVAFS